MIIRRRVAMVVLAMGLAVEGAAFAAPAEMTRLFEQGRALVKEGQYEAAIPKFVEAIAIEPSVGALLNLGDCYERLGKMASARRRFLEAAELAGEADATRWSEARARATKLDTAVARVVFVRRGTFDAEPRITVDGEPLVARADRVEVDPGTHEVIVAFPGAAPDKRSVLVRAAQAQEVVVEAPRKAAAGADPPIAKPPSGDGGGWSAEQWTAVGMGGVGVLALGVGAFFGVVAIGKQSDLDAACPGYPRCPDAQRASVERTYDDANSAATIATVGFITAVALIGTGVALWLVAPDKQKTGAARWGLTF